MLYIDKIRLSWVTKKLIGSAASEIKYRSWDWINAKLKGFHFSFYEWY